MLRWAATPTGVRCAMRTLALSYPPAIGLDYALRVLGKACTPTGVRCAMRTLALSYPPAIGLDYALRVLGKAGTY